MDEWTVAFVNGYVSCVRDQGEVHWEYIDISFIKFTEGWWEIRDRESMKEKMIKSQNYLTKLNINAKIQHSSIIKRSKISNISISIKND